MANNPKYDLDKIKFATDRPTYERAIKLYQNKKVRIFKDQGVGYSATVIGGSCYEVFVSNKKSDEGSCECYLGQGNMLCKHMVAVAIYAVLDGKPFPQESINLDIGPIFSNKKGELNTVEFQKTKELITNAIKYIKPYNGPSRNWFANQNSLEEGCNRLSAIFSKLPASEQTAKLVVSILLRLDAKLSRGGIDDSNGIVGNFIEQSVEMLQEYAKSDSRCKKAFKVLDGKETCFGWEEKLIWQKMEDTKEPLIWNDRLGKIEKESSFFESSTSIGTGLGGGVNSLRYAVIVSPLPSLKIGKKEKVIVKEVVKLTNKKNKNVIEQFKVEKDYMSLVLLVDWHVALDVVVRKFINEVNKKMKIFRSHYFSLNTHIPTDKEIRRYLKEIKAYNRTDWN